jgi:hypothetical protein
MWLAPSLLPCLLASVPPELVAFKPQSPALIGEVAAFLTKRETIQRPMRITPFAALVFPAVLAACASELQNPLVGGVFADPGAYEFYSCEQLAAQRTYWSGRLQDLKLLMDRAEKGTGGAFVSVIAYKGEYVAVQDNLNVVNTTARQKKCSGPENWGSTSAIR